MFDLPYLYRSKTPVKSARSLLLSGVSRSVFLVTLTAAGQTPALAANYTVSTEAEFISAMNSIASDGDPDGTIVLTNDVTISAATTIPAANKTLIIDTTGGHNLTINTAMPHADNLEKVGGGALVFDGQNGPQGRVTVTEGKIEFTNGAQNGGGFGSRYYIGNDDNSTTSLVVGGAGTYVETGVGSRFGGGSDATTTIRVEDGGSLKSNSTTGINSQTVGTTGGSAIVEVTGQGSLFETGRLSSGFRGTVSYSIIDGGSMSTGTTDLGGNVANAGLGDHVLISGAGSNWTSSGIFQFHEGSLTVVNGGALTANELRFAPSGGGRQVNVVVSGNSSSIATTSGDLSIGSTSGTYDSSGTLTVSDGGSISSMAGAGDILLASGALGTGTLNIGGEEGSAAAASGAISAANIVLGAGDATVNFNHTDSNYLLASSLTGSGTVNQIGSGTTLLSGSNTYSGQTNIRDGVLRAANTGVFSAMSGYAITANGTLDLNGFDQTLASLDNAGSVTFGSAPGSTLSISNDYTGSGGVFELHTALGDDNSATDLLHVAGDTSGTSSLKVTNAGGIGAPTIEGIKVVQVDGASNGVFSLQGDFVFRGEQAVVAGAYSYGLYQNGLSTPTDGDWYLRSFLSSSGSPTFQPGVPIYETYAGTLQSFNSFSTLQQRVGNRSWSNSTSGTNADLIETGGLWGRVAGAHANYDPSVSTSRAEYDTDVWKIQIGADSVLSELGSGKLIGGISLHYGTVSADIKAPSGNGGISTTGYGIGGTLTWYSGTGFYLDGQTHMTWYDSDLSSSTASSDLISGNQGFGYALSLEAGQQIDLKPNWSVTPQWQLMYSSVDFDSFVDEFGATVALDQSQSLKGRLGISADYQELETAKGTRTHIYGIANLYYDFADGSETDVAGVNFVSQNQSLWAGLGIGASHNWQGDRYSVYGQLGVDSSIASFGDSSNVHGTFGMRVKW